MKASFLLLSLALLSFAWTQDDATPAPPEHAVLGKPVPSFRLNDHSGKAVQVGGKTDHWTVLAFYPKALTGG